MSRAIAVMLAGMLLIPACRAAPPGGPVPVEGAPAELAGDWSGSYRRDDGEGRGTIAFLLRPGTDTARGQVEMTFAPALRIYGDEAERCDLARRPCTTIDIAVVRVAGDTVRGTLAPYWHPGCDCRAVSEFTGAIAGAQISGRFVTRRESGGTEIGAGSWSVTRAGE